MATPRASAISPISGAAVPEEGEIPSMRSCARARDADALLRCNLRDASGLWNAAQGPDAAKIPSGAFPRAWRGSRGFDRESGGQSRRWKKVRKVKSEVNYRPRRNYRRSPWSSRIAARLYVSPRQGSLILFLYLIETCKKKSSYMDIFFANEFAK